MVACRLSLTANQVDERALQGISQQITLDIPVGMQYYRDEPVFGAQALSWWRKPRAWCAAKTAGGVDEIPGAYKDIDTVMEHQRDLTKTLHTLKQILCIKG